MIHHEPVLVALEPKRVEGKRVINLEELAKIAPFPAMASKLPFNPGRKLTTRTLKVARMARYGGSRRHPRFVRFTEWRPTGLASIADSLILRASNARGTHQRRRHNPLWVALRAWCGSGGIRMNNA